jgi:hypothetical protein
LRVLFQLVFGFCEPLQSSLCLSQVGRQFIAFLLSTLCFIHLTCTPKHFVDLLFPVLLLLTQLSVAHRFVRARIGLQLRTIDRDMPQLHEARLLTQLQRLHKQQTETLQMLAPEARDCVVIGMLVSG